MSTGVAKWASQCSWAWYLSRRKKLSKGYELLFKLRFIPVLFQLQLNFKLNIISLLIKPAHQIINWLIQTAIFIVQEMAFVAFKITVAHSTIVATEDRCFVEKTVWRSIVSSMEVEQLMTLDQRSIFAKWKQVYLKVFRFLEYMKENQNNIKGKKFK